VRQAELKDLSVLVMMAVLVRWAVLIMLPVVPIPEEYSNERKEQ